MIIQVTDLKTDATVFVDTTNQQWKEFFADSVVSLVDACIATDWEPCVMGSVLALKASQGATMAVEKLRAVHAIQVTATMN